MIAYKDWPLGTSRAYLVTMATTELVSLRRPIAVFIKGDGAAHRSLLRDLFAWEAVVFFGICLLDMLTTLWWSGHGIAVEGNPILAPLLRANPLLFAAGKIISFLPALIVCGLYRRQHPQFVATALRLAIVAYLAVYCITVGLQFFP